jgi:hypothetical protein
VKQGARSRGIQRVNPCFRSLHHGWSVRTERWNRKGGSGASTPINPKSEPPLTVTLDQKFSPAKFS